MMLLWWLGALLATLGWSVSACPQHCSCFTDPDGYISANCSVLALGAQQSRSQIEMLSFQPKLGGYGTRLFPRAFQNFHKAKFIWMVNCSVLDLPTDVFHGLNYVIRLDLSYNKIRHLNGAVFKPLVSLTTLKLRSNPLELTPWDVIVSDRLQELDLGHCGLRTIPFGTFVGVPHLSRLYLDGNEIRTLTYNTLPSTLRYVNLSRNRISLVPSELLRSMSHLRKIDLSKNPVNCTCNLLIVQDWYSGQGVIFDNGVTCVEPSQYKGKRLSKINENELCSQEEVKRHRRINDIQSYRDSESHRTHNMIRDPDFQSDQPDGQNYAEVLFPGDGLTHMEMSKPFLPTDVSDENNKLAESKHSSEMIEPTIERADSREELLHEVTIQSTKDIDEHESSAELLSEATRNHVPVNASVAVTESTDFDHAGFVTTGGHGSANNLTESETTHDELAAEGYSPVYNLSDIMLSDAEGSGDDMVSPFHTSNFPEEESKEISGLTPETFTFPSSKSEVSDYNYDSHHDYSAEVTTEPMSTFVEEGSGEPDNETLSSVFTHSMMEEENGTSSEDLVIVDSIPSFNSSTVDYSSSSLSYSSSSESFDPAESSSSVSTMLDSSSAMEGSSPVEPSSTTFVLLVETSFQSTSENPTTSEETSLSSSLATAISSSEWLSSTPEAPTSSSLAPRLFPEVPEGPMTTESEESREEVTTVIIQTEVPSSSSSAAPISEVEIIKMKDMERENKKEQMVTVGTAEEERSVLAYIVGGLLLALILLIALALIWRRIRARSEKKVRLPTDLEATPGTELQDMLLPRPAENGVKILPVTNGKGPNEDEKEALRKEEWTDDKNEPIETVTARLSVIAGPQTPIFIHKTLA